MQSLFNKYARFIHHKLSIIYGAISRLTNNIFSLPPTKINVVFTSKCNVLCNFCYVDKNLNQKEPNRLKLEEWDKIIESTPKTCVTIFTGGEPFASNELYSVVEKYLDKKKLVSITTNGTLIEPLKIKSLIDKKLFYLMFSIHGLEVTHNKIVQRPYAYRKIMENLSFIHEYKKTHGLTHPLICLKAVISPENVDEIPELIETFENNNLVNQIYFNLMSPTTLHHSLDIIESLEDPRLYQDTSYKYPDEFKNKVINLISHIEKFKENSKIDIGFTDDFSSISEMKKYIEDPSLFKIKNCNRPWHELILYYDGTFSSCLGFKGGTIQSVNYNINKLIPQPDYRNFLNFIKENEPNNQACKSCKEAPFRR